ncbi:MAG TPA: hypothetical protein PK733_16515 [Clostridiales bacterium]|nr:hypothetical protein [Clostridiales bacterium]
MSELSNIVVLIVKYSILLFLILIVTYIATTIAWISAIEAVKENVDDADDKEKILKQRYIKKEPEKKASSCNIITSIEPEKRKVG